jgi:hypothetical protein
MHMSPVETYASLWWVCRVQCRIYSRFIALQIDAIEEGRLEKAS